MGSWRTLRVCLLQRPGRTWGGRGVDTTGPLYDAVNPRIRGEPRGPQHPPVGCAGGLSFQHMNFRGIEHSRLSALVTVRGLRSGYGFLGSTSSVFSCPRRLGVGGGCPRPRGQEKVCAALSGGHRAGLAGEGTVSQQGAGHRPTSPGSRQVTREGVQEVEEGHTGDCGHQGSRAANRELGNSSGP